MEPVLTDIAVSVRPKSTPILFSPANTLANLQGRKTMTRRLIKFPSVSPLLNDWKQAVQIPNDHSWIFWDHAQPMNAALTSATYKPGAGIPCPYGVPGDELWTRETAILERYGGLWSMGDPLPPSKSNDAILVKNECSLSKTLKLITTNDRLDLEKIETLSDKTRDSLVQYLIRKRAPVVVELIPEGFDTRWMACMGYFYFSEQRGYKFVHSVESMIK